MKGYAMYSEIKQLKEKGFKKDAVAKQLNINWRTVDKYWNMQVEEYNTLLKRISKITLLNDYEGILLKWIKEYPSISAAQINDWLKEHYKISFKERTVSRYVKNLRKRHNLKKAKVLRDYEAVEEMPMGKQLQVDFGEKWMKTTENTLKKVYFSAFVLANSRNKYVYLQSRPFTTTDLVKSCKSCFEFIGGIPQELVFDQDSVVLVSENVGELIHTFEFEKLRQEYKFSVYMCRRADPECKGKVENVVKYIKGNFLENRIYIDDDTLNFSAIEWLERTANAKVHGTTKLIPSEVMKEEREYLKPFIAGISNDAKILRTVRKDNTICFDSNRYSVPLGTYSSNKEVVISINEDMLKIETETETETELHFICEHKISLGRGMLIQNTNHKRDRKNAIDKIQNTLDERLDYKITEFLQKIRTLKSRYARDQFKLINTLCDKYDMTDILRGVEYCDKSKLISATYLKDYLEYTAKSIETKALVTIPLSDNKYHVTTQKRSLEEYSKVGVTYYD